MDDLTRGIDTLLAVALVSALAPFVVAVLPGNRVPQVVVLIVGGILIGPQALGLAEPDSIELFSNVGLGFVFLLVDFCFIFREDARCLHDLSAGTKVVKAGRS